MALDGNPVIPEVVQGCGVRLREAWHASWMATLRKSFAAVVDQAIVSISSFALAIMLARSCSNVEYGSFAVAFSAMWLLTGISQALIHIPMLILGPRHGTDGFKKYVSALCVIQALVCVLSSLGLLLAVVVIQGFDLAPQIIPALMGLVPAVIFFQFREFFRYVLFARLRPLGVLLNDVCYCSVVITGIVLMKEVGYLSGRNAFFLIAAASFLSSGLGLLQVREHLTLARPRLRITLRENWEFGRWNLGNSIFYNLLVRSNIFIIAGFVGVAATGALDAARMVLAPAQILLFASSNVAQPRASGIMAREGRRGLNRFLSRFFWGLTAVFSLYFVCTMAVPEFFLDLLYGGKYSGEGGLVRLWALVHLLLLLSFIPMVSLNAMLRPDIIVVSLAVGFSVSLGLCYVFVPVLGVHGAVTALLCGTVALLGLVLISLFRPGIENRPVVRDVGEGRMPLPCSKAPDVIPVEYDEVVESGSPVNLNQTSFSSEETCVKI